MAMTPKENILAALRGEPHDYVPNFFSDLDYCGATALTFDAGPLAGGYDDFGVLWETSESAGGQACPITTDPVLKDISEWRDKVRFPDVDAFDWAAAAQRQVGNADRQNRLIEFQMWSGPFERVTHLMGFENALCAMYEDPDEMTALLDAITDYKIEVLKRAKQYYDPDFVTTLDDVATERGLFMSPALYRELIKPAHRRFNDAAREMGIVPIIHCCGKCEDIIPDFIEEGFAAWTSAQPSNDIRSILAATVGKFAVCGGFDTNGMPARPDSTEEEMREEVRRCIRDYAEYPNYIFFGFKLANSPDLTEFLKAIRIMADECRKAGKLR